MYDRTKLPLNVGDQIWVNMPVRIVNGYSFIDTDKCDIIKIDKDKYGEEVLCAQSCESKRKYRFNQEQIYSKDICKVITEDNCPDMYL